MSWFEWNGALRSVSTITVFRSLNFTQAYWKYLQRAGRRKVSISNGLEIQKALLPISIFRVFESYIGIG
jgi:hypothetical protein